MQLRVGGRAWCLETPRGSPGCLRAPRTQGVLRSWGARGGRWPSCVAWVGLWAAESLLAGSVAAFPPRWPACLGCGRWRLRKDCWAGLGGSSLEQPMLPGSVPAQTRPRAEGGRAGGAGHSPRLWGSAPTLAALRGLGLPLKTARPLSAVLGTDGAPLGCLVGDLPLALGGVGLTGGPQHLCDARMLSLGWALALTASPCLTLLAGVGGGPCSSQCAGGIARGACGGACGCPVRTGVGRGSSAVGPWQPGCVCLVVGGKAGQASSLEGQSWGDGAPWGRRGGRGRRPPPPLLSGVLQHSQHAAFGAAPTVGRA